MPMQNAEDSFRARMSSLLAQQSGGPSTGLAAPAPYTRHGDTIGSVNATGGRPAPQQGAPRTYGQPGYLDYLLNQVRADQAAVDLTPTNRPTPEGYAALLSALAHGAQQSAQNPNRQGSRVRFDGTNSLQGLFGGGQVLTSGNTPRKVVAPPGFEPQTTTYEDDAIGVTGAHQDPTLMLLQQWLARRFPNEM